MIHSDLALLDESIRDKAASALVSMRGDSILQSLGVQEIQVHETLRDIAVQMAYYSRNRMSIADVKWMYKAAGLYEISSVDAGKPITWTLESKHLLGKAIDIVPYKNGKPWWVAPLEVWLRMGELGEANGLTWGGRWKHTDNPHYEIA